ncbi:MAG: Rv0340 family IniB-related protein [Mycobacterium sp.]
MANSLLDFVMSLVRDPDAAARYAADPAGAIAEAHLTDVTSADVNNLIPMVADSLSMAAPAIGGGHAADANVWASGAATAAFDAFGAHPPASVTDPHPVIADVITHPADAAQSALTDAGLDPVAGATATVDEISQVSDPAVGHHPGAELLPDWAEGAGWEHSHTDDPHAPADHPGFDIF